MLVLVVLMAVTVAVAVAVVVVVAVAMVMVVVPEVVVEGQRVRPATLRNALERRTSTIRASGPVTRAAAARSS